MIQMSCYAICIFDIDDQIVLSCVNVYDDQKALSFMCMMSRFDDQKVRRMYGAAF